MTISDSVEQNKSRKEEVIRLIEERECATVSLSEAAQVLGIHRTTAWELWRRGAFPVGVLDLGAKRHRVTKWIWRRYLIGDEDRSHEPETT